MLRIAYVFLCLLAVSGRAEAANRTVCRTGCQYSSLQAAIDAAAPGDVILLRAGETFVGNVMLKAKPSSTAWITIRSDAADSDFPGPGERLIPEGKPGANTLRSKLARLIGAGGTLKSTPVIRTQAGAHHYRLQFLEIDGTANLGYETLVALGDNSGRQTSLSQVPHSLVIDRVYLHGHKTKGMKRAISLDSRATDIINSYMSDFMSFSDSQAIGGFNGPGPFRIVNNYLEAAGENIMFGGVDPKISNLVPSDIEIRGNHFSKQLAWRNPILAAPSRPTVAPRTGGSLAAGGHYFKVVAIITTGGAQGYSAPSGEAYVAVSSNGAAHLSWGAVTGADKYRVYRGTSSNGQSRYIDTTGTSLTYTGAGESSGTPRASGTRWTSKNLLELKNAQRVRIDGNIMEHNWAGFQDGFAIVFTPRNQSGSAPWSVVKDVTFVNNTVRKVAAAIKILGWDYTYPSQQARGFRIENNVFEDVSNSWGNTGRFLLLTSSPADIVVNHNTIVHTGTVVEVDRKNVSGFVFTNNYAKHNAYGVKGEGLGTGLDTLKTRFAGYVFKGNVLAGGKASLYPPYNYFPSVTDFNASFVNPSAGDYSLKSGSPYLKSATDGSAIGVNLGTLRLAQADSDASASSAGTTGGEGSGDAEPDSDPEPSPSSTTDGVPSADAGGPYTTARNTALLLDGSASSDPEGALITYQWTCGDDVVLHAADVPSGAMKGNWRRVSSSSAARGVLVENPDAGAAKVEAPLASPASYVEFSFEAAKGVPYYVWVRMRAKGDSYNNDSVYLQFSGTVSSAGAAQYRIGSSSALAVILEEGRGAGLAGWGWNDAHYGGLAAPIYFGSAGPQKLRIQPREDGVSIDQVIVSSRQFAGTRPGETKADDRIVPLAIHEGMTLRHTYTRVGTYPVRLTVTDAKGQKASDGALVTVK